MKRKIIVILNVVFLLFLLGGLHLVTKIENATTKVDNLIRLHRIEILREDLLIQLKKSQTDLYLRNTRYARTIDTVLDHVQTMDKSLSGCFGCHHSASSSVKLAGLKSRIAQYKTALSRAFTIRANQGRLEEEEDNAFKIGTELISDVDDITTLTNRKLEERTQEALGDIRRTKNILYVFFGAAPIVMFFLSVVFFRSFTRPVDSLLAATRQLKAGDLDFRIEGLQDEYGEVASSFNEMASSLKEHYLRMQWAEQVVVLGELAGGLAHEMKNPLAGIKGSIQVLSGDGSLPGETRTILLKVIEQIERIEILLRSLLNFAQPPKPAFLPVDVNEVLDTTISLTQKHPSFLPSGAREITIVRDFDPQLPRAMADPIQLQQVFMNLFLNGAEAMPKGGTLTVRTRHEEGGTFLRVAIKDTGNGIDEALIHKIFHPFFTTKAKGTGLGLAISKRLVEQHGGSIHVENNPRRGTSFTIELPIKAHNALST
jgi:signal transduction histidine kinase